jgi:flagellar biosynthesis protein FliQ
METALLTEALQLALTLLMPVLGACLVVALLSAFLQGALQAGDSSLSFVPKLLAVLAVLWLSRGLVSERLLQFTTHVIAAIGQLGR